MKLKYYMRGLGIGILITTIVLSIGGKKEKLTDEEIMARAKELGMVMTKEDNDDNLEEVLEKSLGKADQETEDATEPTDENNDTAADGDMAETTEDDTNTDADVNIDADTATDTPTSTDTPTDTPTATDVVTDIPEPTHEGSDTDQDEDENEPDKNATGPATEEQPTQITFTIIKGMSSGQVSELLAQKGLIKDAVDFDDYIKRQGKAGVIRIGTYTLPKDADYQTILKAITG